MSLVLDALRRREAESDPYRRTVLDAPSTATRSARPWIALVAIGLLINAAALTWFMITRPIAENGLPAASSDSGGKTTPASESQTPAASLPTAPLPGAPPADAAAPAITAPSAPPLGAPAVTASAASGGPVSLPVAAPITVPAAPPLPAIPVRTLERIDLEDLPDAARSRLPGIVISSHVYADDPMERTIIANGVTLREGSVLAGLPLREIRGDSIVVEFESWLLEIPVFSEW